MRKDIIYCIGDSHVNVFSGNNSFPNQWPGIHVDRVPIFKTFWLGAHLAYSLHKPKSKARKALFAILPKIPKGSRLILSYGEIDCRVHLIRQSEIQQRPLQDVVFECVDKYFRVINQVRKRGYDVIVYHLIPSTAFKIEYQEFPTYGSCIDRNKVTVLFNTRLSYWAKKYRLEEFSIYKYFVNAKGITDMKYYADPIHLSTNALPMIIKEINKNITGIDKKLLNKKYSINILEYLYFCILRKKINYLYISIRSLI